MNTKIIFPASTEYDTKLTLTIPQPFFITIISTSLCQCKLTDLKSKGIEQRYVLYGKSSGV